MDAVELLCAAEAIAVRDSVVGCLPRCFEELGCEVGGFDAGGGMFAYNFCFTSNRGLREGNAASTDTSNA